MIEVVFENFDIKKEVFFKFDKICKLLVILCINIFIIDIDRVSLLENLFKVSYVVY